MSNIWINYFHGTVDETFVVPRNLDVEVDCQLYMDMFVAYDGKKPKFKEQEEWIQELCGGKQGFKNIKKAIKDWEKEIKKNFPDMVPETPIDDLEEDDL